MTQWEQPGNKGAGSFGIKACVIRQNGWVIKRKVRYQSVIATLVCLEGGSQGRQGNINYHLIEPSTLHPAADKWEGKSSAC